MDYSYKLTTTKNKSLLKYFIENPLSKWSLGDYMDSKADINSTYPSTKKLLNMYIQALQEIQDLDDLPHNVRHEVVRLSIEFEGQVKYIDGNQSSDVSEEYHPRRTCEYIISFLPMDTINEHYKGETTKDGEEISDKIFTECRNVRLQHFRKYKKIEASQISDTRLLILNDIFLLNKDSEDSAIKYFRQEVKDLIEIDNRLEKHKPPPGKFIYDTCKIIKSNPPTNVNTVRSIRHEFEDKTRLIDNIVDTVCATILGPLLCSLLEPEIEKQNEDTYVHNFLTPLLKAVFTFEKGLKNEWANGQLEDSNGIKYKPDFSIKKFSDKPYTILVAEFKPINRNSLVQSDLVKLGKELKVLINNLVEMGVKSPVVYGIQTEGSIVRVYSMDLIGPQTYKMVRLGFANLSVKMQDINYLPELVSFLLGLKGLIFESVDNIDKDLQEESVDRSLNSWLSYTSVEIKRSPGRKRKQLKFFKKQNKNKTAKIK